MFSQNLYSGLFPRAHQVKIPQLSYWMEYGGSTQRPERVSRPKLHPVSTGQILLFQANGFIRHLKYQAIRKQQLTRILKCQLSDQVNALCSGLMPYLEELIIV
jgi:hypothetical protein